MKKIGFFIAFLLACPPLSGAETVGLKNALRAAIKERPFVRAARQEASAAQAGVGEARSRYLPRLVLSENLTWTDEPAGSLFISLNQRDLSLHSTAEPYNDPPSRKDFETRLTLEQPLYNSEISYGLRRAKKGAEAAAASARWSSEEAAFDAFRAYLEVQQAGAAFDWVQSSRKDAEEILRLAGQRHEAGVGLKADELRARVFLAEAKRRAVTAENDLAIARRSLAMAMGRTGGEVDIAEPVTPEALGGSEEESPMARADLEALSLSAEEAGLAYRQSRAAYLPRIGLAASYALHDGEAPFGTEADAWTLQAGLTWELFDGLRRPFSSDRAAARKEAAESRRLEATRQAQFAREKAELRAEEAKKNLETANLAVDEAAESHRLVLQRYDAGLADLSDLLGAQTAFDRARFDAVNARSRYLLALGNIRFQSGNFVQTLLPSEENSK
jgi:outer membrane protein